MVVGGLFLNDYEFLNLSFCYGEHGMDRSWMFGVCVFRGWHKVERKGAKRQLAERFFSTIMFVFARNFLTQQLKCHDRFVYLL